MRVVSVKITGHPGFGDLYVDFSSSDGRTSKFVVIAGENGTGKSAILDCIFKALGPDVFTIGQPKGFPAEECNVVVEADNLSKIKPQIVQIPEQSTPL